VAEEKEKKIYRLTKGVKGLKPLSESERGEFLRSRSNNKRMKEDTYSHKKSGDKAEREAHQAEQLPKRKQSKAYKKISEGLEGREKAIERRSKKRLSDILKEQMI